MTTKKSISLYVIEYLFLLTDMTNNDLIDWLSNSFSTTNTTVNYIDFTIQIILCAIFCYILGMLYSKYGRTLSNRKNFASNFILIGITTTIIITIVKSSLALSLGLVGALSIVRFRTAIKEPEELSYIFLIIAIGLGFGAGLIQITIISFVLILIFILIKSLLLSKHDQQNLHLTISSYNPKRVKIETIIESLKEDCQKINLKRFDENEQILEASFLIEIKNYQELSTVKDKLKNIDPSISISFLDNKGIF